MPPWSSYQTRQRLSHLDLAHLAPSGKKSLASETGKASTGSCLGGSLTLSGSGFIFFLGLPGTFAFAASALCAECLTNSCLNSALCAGVGLLLAALYLLVHILQVGIVTCLPESSHLEELRANQHSVLLEPPSQEGKNAVHVQIVQDVLVV